MRALCKGGAAGVCPDVPDAAARMWMRAEADNARVNYLAHVFLARHSEEAMLGALLGDFVKGTELDGFPIEVQREIRMHRLIDAYTDEHPLNVQARALFEPGRRRFAGIVLDVFYDHLLTRAWPRYSDEPIDAVVQRLHAALGRHAGLLPPRLVAIAPRLVSQQWLRGYGEVEGFETAIRRMSCRLSKGQDRMVAALEDVRVHRHAIEQAFEGFFPELIDHVTRVRNGSAE